MNTVRIAVALVALVALTGGVGTAVAAPPEKVQLCHDIENTGETLSTINGRTLPIYEGTTIEVSERAKDAHIGHGDLVGDCDTLQNSLLFADYDNDGDNDVVRIDGKPAVLRERAD